jgi:hypothetical protein
MFKKTKETPFQKFYKKILEITTGHKYLTAAGEGFNIVIESNGISKTITLSYNNYLTPHKLHYTENKYDTNLAETIEFIAENAEAILKAIYEAVEKREKYLINQNKRKNIAMQQLAEVTNAWE